MQNLCSNWSPWCLLSNEINFTQKFFVDKKLWSKQWAKVIFQYWFQSDLSTFKLLLLPNYRELFNYLWLTYFKLIIGAESKNLLTGTKCGVYSNWYFITFMDDFSKYSYVYLMKNKIDAFEKLSKWSSSKSKICQFKFDQRQLTLIRTSKNIGQISNLSNKILFFSILNIMKLPLKW